MTVEVIDVVLPPIEVVDLTPPQVELLDVVVGPPGPRGPAGSGAVVVEVPVASATWSIPHNLGRLPAVQLVVDGQPFDTPMTVSPTHVVVTWPFPVAGSAILI